MSDERWYENYSSLAKTVETIIIIKLLFQLIQTNKSLFLYTIII